MPEGRSRCRSIGSVRVFASLGELSAMMRESDVAEAVWQAVNDATGTLRFPAGPDALALACASRPRSSSS